MSAANKANDGRAFQDTLVGIFGEYERRGIATIRKIDPPVRVMGGGKARRVIFMPNPWLDFAGTTNRGHAIIIEAKSTSEARLGINDRGIKPHQMEIALRWRGMGAIVFFLWHFTDGTHEGVRLVLPSQVLAAERKSLRWDDAFRIPRGTGFLLFDPLRAYVAATSGSTPGKISQP